MFPAMMYSNYRINKQCITITVSVSEQTAEVVSSRDGTDDNKSFKIQKI